MPRYVTVALVDAVPLITANLLAQQSYVTVTKGYVPLLLLSWITDNVKTHLLNEVVKSAVLLVFGFNKRL